VNRTASDPSSTATSVLSKLRAREQLQDTSSNWSVEARLHDSFSNASRDGQQFRKYALELLKATYLPKHPLPSSSDGGNEEGCFSWVCRVADFVKPSKSLDVSLYAFCLAQIHVTNLGNVSLHQCLESYSTALQHLYADLDDPERRFQEDTLAAILVLSTCEVCEQEVHTSLNETPCYSIKLSVLWHTCIALLTTFSSFLFVQLEMAGVFTQMGWRKFYSCVAQRQRVVQDGATY
jgi:hypothetical protein